MLHICVCVLVAVGGFEARGCDGVEPSGNKRREGKRIPRRSDTKRKKERERGRRIGTRGTTERRRHK